ncbi:hypothetical protein [Acinetobacter sp.]|uniref:hypothetical protein n=1 Tax=Acinetobacter sp. TaxID=472 RepID=UPI0035ADD4D6
MLIFLPLLIRLLNLEHFQCRNLTDGEIALCQTVFGSLIDYTQVQIMNQPYLPWQPKHVVMAPEGRIHALAPSYSPDYALESRPYQGLFIHEMTHIYQHQQRINVLLRGALLQSAFWLSRGKYNPYEYRLQEGKKFFDYNIEQQGNIARDIFFKRISNIILNTETSSQQP